MKIHVISTINGQENEGMRNIATHYTREWEKKCEVRYSGLKDIIKIIRNTLSCDATVVFARAGKATYYLIKLLCILSKNIWLVCVQKPESVYKELCEKSVPKNHYFSLMPEDIKGLRIENGCKNELLRVGINEKKFVPVSLDETNRIKLKYGFSPDKKLVVHVGHCSVGRGLEKFIALNDESIEKLVVASGMFEDENTKTVLQKAGVKILTGYLPKIEEIYQMADVYLFPTKSDEFVISIPLSVIEALACGTPVVACSNLSGLKQIDSFDEAISIISDENNLMNEIIKLCDIKSNETLLRNPISWSVGAAEALSVIKENLK